MKRRVTTSFLLMGTGLVILTILLGAVSLAAPAQVPENRPLTCHERGCNEQLVPGDWCAPGLVPYNGRCRNPACPKETDCECPTPHCPDATITVRVTECNAPLVGASVELHSSYGDKYGPKTTNAAGEATFSVIGGSDRLWYAMVNGVRMGPTIKVTECGGTGTVDPVFPCAVTPTPTPIAEVSGVEKLPVAGPVLPSPGVPSLLVGVSLLFVASGGLLRWFDRRG